jgi:uncharacterized repeat protein (TIGR04138 family)
MSTKSAQRVEQAIRQDGRYPLEAYRLLQRGLARATEAAYGASPFEPTRHVTGRQLCEALRDVARETWGMLAPVVLKHWNIHSTRDFGEMVFLLVRLRVLRKHDSDCIEDFEQVYDFDEVFGQYSVPVNELEV